MVKRTHPFDDDASKYSGASSKSKPVGKRGLALAAVRHDKSSLMIIVQEKTQSDVKGKVNPGQASGDRLHFPSVQARGDPLHEVARSDGHQEFTNHRTQRAP